ncbi:hypothetical protein M378DRAFT_172665 [Amanita muscaria Koide BX008]|uniref:Uncharacterized protein n=1 Tax=Amanita muscaria (strain Koide BX008) TaxID=946122 RepID=A0A0C2WK23_AMAMK|nr:hypothetical protein M378DRAFT_172665 [Amanita muscaria Koide BX008]
MNKAVLPLQLIRSSRLRADHEINLPENLNPTRQDSPHPLCFSPRSLSFDYESEY